MPGRVRATTRSSFGAPAKRSRVGVGVRPKDADAKLPADAYKDKPENLNHSRIPEDEGLRLWDSEVASPAASIRVHFDKLEERLLEYIQKADVIVGCVAWLTNFRLLEALRRKQGVRFVIQREDFLRPDVGAGNNFPALLRAAYDSLPMLPLIGNYEPGNTQVNNELLDRINTTREDEGHAVQMAGTVNPAPDKIHAWPRMHHKFAVFLREKKPDVPSRNWKVVRPPNSPPSEKTPLDLTAHHDEKQANNPAASSVDAADLRANGPVGGGPGQPLAVADHGTTNSAMGSPGTVGRSNHDSKSQSAPTGDRSVRSFELIDAALNRGETVSDAEYAAHSKEAQARFDAETEKLMEEACELEPYAVWTGSFNWTANGSNSFENGVYIDDAKIASAFYSEFAQIFYRSCPLNWEDAWKPGARNDLYRIGT